MREIRNADVDAHIRGVSGDVNRLANKLNGKKEGFSFIGLLVVIIAGAIGGIRNVVFWT